MGCLQQNEIGVNDMTTQNYQHDEISCIKLKGKLRFILPQGLVINTIISTLCAS